MKNPKTRKNGFVMLLVIFALSAIALWLTIMAFNSKMLHFQAERAYLDACRQNLIASALAWSNKNSDTLKTSTDVKLDTDDMNVKSAALRVTVISAKKELKQVEITASCSKGAQKLTSCEKFDIK